MHPGKISLVPGKILKEKTKRRMTKQRTAILDVLRDTKSHPTADWIYDRVREKMPNISLGTVYRNLKVLQEMGEIRELNYGSSYSRFDGNPENHYHFTCQECEGVFDVELEVRDELNSMVEENMGYMVYDHRCEFYGICEDCRMD